MFLIIHSDELMQLSSIFYMTDLLIFENRILGKIYLEMEVIFRISLITINQISKCSFHRNTKVFQNMIDINLTFNHSNITKKITSFV